MDGELNGMNMTSAISLELVEVKEENIYDKSSVSEEEHGVSIESLFYKSQCVTDENTDDSHPSSVDDAVCTTNPAKRLPSFCNLNGITGLQPTKNEFDCGVIKCLETLFNDTATEALEEEKLKTFLRIRPSTFSCVEEKGKKDKSVQAKKALIVKNDTTVVTFPLQKTVNSFPVGGRMQAERNKTTEYTFTKVLGPECSQTDVFEECVSSLIEKFLKNENCLIFSYGATNSGKTYTLQGHGTDFGIIPRTLDAIFNRIQDRLCTVGTIKPQLYESFHQLSQIEQKLLQEKKEKVLIEAANIKNELITMKENVSYMSQSSSQGSTISLLGARDFSNTNYALFANSVLFSVWVSFAELYNEKVYDLLETIPVGSKKKRRERRLLQDQNGFVYIKDLTELHVTSDDEAYKIFLAGRKNLQFAATQMNQRSSRSHSFFTIRVVSIGIGSNLMSFPKSVHRMTFCDLAGMERTSQTENEGARLKESSSINISLTVLLKVIRLLREKQAHGNVAIETIPFRESKLTHIFKSFLTSSTHICMIVNVNPDPKMADSTLQVLHNSAIASNVIAFRPFDQEAKNLKHQTRGFCKADKAKKPNTDNKENENPVKATRSKKQRQKTAFDSTSQSDTDDEKKKVPSAYSSSSESNDKGQTVIAPRKLLQQEVLMLRKEVLDLKKQLKNVELEKQKIRMENLAQLCSVRHDCEIEKQQLRNTCVQLLAEQSRKFSDRYSQCLKWEENISRRKLSLMGHGQTNSCISLSPVSGRNHTPPRAYMENIHEDEDEA